MNVGFGFTKVDEDGIVAANGADIGRRAYGMFAVHWIVDTILQAQAGSKWTNVDNDTVLGSTPPTSPSATATAGSGLISGQTYYYRVAVKHGTTVCDWTAKVNATASGGNLQITVSWGAPAIGANPGNYRVYRSFSGLEGTWDEFKDVAGTSTVDANTGWTSNANAERLNPHIRRMIKYTNGSEVLYFEFLRGHTAPPGNTSHRGIQVAVWSDWNFTTHAGQGNRQSIYLDIEGAVGNSGVGAHDTTDMLANFYGWIDEERLVVGMEGLLDSVYPSFTTRAGTIAWERVATKLFNNGASNWLMFGSGSHVDNHNTQNIAGVTSDQRDAQPWDNNRRNLFMRAPIRNALDNRVYWAWPVMASGSASVEDQIIAQWAGKHWVPLRDDLLQLVDTVVDVAQRTGLTHKDTVVLVEGATTRQYLVFLPNPTTVSSAAFNACLILKSET